MSERQAILITALAFLAVATGLTLAKIAPRTTPEAERAQRVTPPWLSGERR